MHKHVLKQIYTRVKIGDAFNSVKIIERLCKFYEKMQQKGNTKTPRTSLRNIQLSDHV
jgi:hypothetical protein